MKTILTIFFCLALFHNDGQAQENGIKGRIIDSFTQKPMSFINLRLKDTSDSLILSTQSKEDGSFYLSKIPKGSYTLNISAVGNTTKQLVVVQSHDRQFQDLGLIYISPENNNLNEVTITGEKQLIKHEIDRISYDLQADPDSRSSNLLEMIKKVPLLSLDADDNIQLKGNSGFKILIDGRPSSMLERNFKDILRSIPASTIKKIEVITNPPARYDGEGIAGIVNIITLKKVDNGYNGGFNLSHRSPIGGPAAGGSLGAKIGKFGLSANSGGSLYHNPLSRSDVNRLTQGNAPARLSQQQDIEQESRSAYLGLELSFEPDTLNLITGQFNINGNASENKNIQESVMAENNQIVQGYHLRSEAKGNGEGVDASLNYQRGFRGNRSRLVTLSYRYYQFADRSDNLIDISERVFYTAPSLFQLNRSVSSEQTLQADYIQRVGAVNFEGGIKMIFRRNTSRFSYTETGGSVIPAIVPASINFFKDKQKVMATYGSMHYTAKRLGIKAGVRLEQTEVDADFMSSATSVNSSYFSMLPSLSLNYKTGESHNVTGGYSRRIQRPGIYQLNPFVDRSNPDFEISGNPALKPIMYNALDLGFSSTRQLSIFVNLSYMFSKVMIFKISDYDQTSRITKTTYENTGRTKLYGLNYSIKYPLSQRSSINLNGKLAYGMISRLDNGQTLKHNGFMYRYYASATHKIKDTWYLSIDAMLNSGNLGAQGQSSSFFTTSFKADRTIIKDKLSIAATVSNPFSKYRYNTVETTSPAFKQTNNSEIYFRVFNFSANYRFGKLNDAVKKSKRSIRNDDVSGNGGL